MIVPKGALLTIILISLCVYVTEGTMTDWASLYMKERYPEQLPIVKQQILVYPTFALLDTDSFRLIENSPVLNEKVLHYFIHAFAGFNETVIYENIMTDPFVNPMLSPQGLHKMPPAFFVVAGLDPLQDDSKIYARYLQSAGVPTRTLFYPFLNHGFFTMSLFYEAKLALNEIVGHLRENKICCDKNVHVKR